MNIDKIYIPTLGRVDNQITYNTLPDFLKKITYLVIQDQELSEIKKNYPDANLIRLPNEIKVSPELVNILLDLPVKLCSVCLMMIWNSLEETSIERL